MDSAAVLKTMKCNLSGFTACVTRLCREYDESRTAGIATDGDRIAK